MICCYVGLGSNLRSPRRQLAHAIKALARLPQTALLRQSSVYLSEPWGLHAQPMYCNSVVELSTRLPPHTLLKHLQAIETAQGRVRKKPWGPRTLDLDMLLYGTQTLQTPTLTLPHKHLLTRDFVILPLLEIAPNVRLPDGQHITANHRSLSFVKSTTL